MYQYFFHILSGNIRSGLVFDGMSKEDGLAKGSQNSSYSFGSRPPVRLPTSKSLSKQKQGLITKKALHDSSESSTGKENIINLQTSGKWIITLLDQPEAS